ncbi:unnamed protein product [Protopolystoma xenopodis]|uniref:RRM domain-containing protein n=1 Tax=Protopolystoma xenopodis TaxID=117903 RepID=A0A3S5A7I3_9PLAT|nr:unnamed protein product [Protopolystoma xenopodis]
MLVKRSTTTTTPLTDEKAGNGGSVGVSGGSGGGGGGGGVGVGDGSADLIVALDAGMAGCVVAGTDYSSTVSMGASSGLGSSLNPRGHVASRKSGLLRGFSANTSNSEGSPSVTVSANICKRPSTGYSSLLSLAAGPRTLSTGTDLPVNSLSPIRAAFSLSNISSLSSTINSSESKNSRYTCGRSSSNSTASSVSSGGKVSLRGVKVTRLSSRLSSDAQLKTGLFAEFRRYGHISSVVVLPPGHTTAPPPSSNDSSTVGSSTPTRCAVITYQKCADAERAYQAYWGADKQVLGSRVCVSLHPGFGKLWILTILCIVLKNFIPYWSIC